MQLNNIKFLNLPLVISVALLCGFSAHADQTQLLEWAQQFRNKPAFYLVHGEDVALTALQDALQDQGISARIAEQGHSVVF